MDKTASIALFDTAPPEETLPPLVRFKQRLVGTLSAAIMPVVSRAARPYLGGQTIAEALCVARRLRSEGAAVTFGYWDTGHQGAQAVAAVQADALTQISDLDAYVSLKPPALHYAPEIADALASIAAARGLGLHCDSHGVEAADPSNAFADALAAKLGPARVGTTLPGRWHRSLADADWAAARGFNVRVVKGQWPDPADPKRDLAEGFLAVIEQLCGRASRVAVATHDFDLGRAALTRLQETGTPCELEVLLGMPSKQLFVWAQANGFKTRIYVPYGPGFIPNAIGVLKRNPRLLLAVAKDRVRAAGEFVGAMMK